MQSCDTETEPFTEKITVLIYSFRSEVLVFDISFFYNKLPYFMILRCKYFHNLTSQKLKCFTSHSAFLLLLLSRVSRVRLCATPQTAAHQAPPSLGFLQARTLEWVAISFSNAWKWKVKVKSLSHVRLFATSWTAAYQAPLSMGFSKQEYWSGVPLPSLVNAWELLFIAPEADGLFGNQSPRSVVGEWTGKERMLRQGSVIEWSGLMVTCKSS